MRAKSALDEAMPILNTPRRALAAVERRDVRRRARPVTTPAPIAVARPPTPARPPTAHAMPPVRPAQPTTSPCRRCLIGRGRAADDARAQKRAHQLIAFQFAQQQSQAALKTQDFTLYTFIDGRFSRARDATAEK